MAVAEPALPGALSEAHEVGFDHRDGRGVDFEPYSVTETAITIE